MRKTKKKSFKLDTKYIAVVGVIVVALLVGGVSMTKAGGSFWGGIQQLVSEGILNDIRGQAPDMSVEDIMVGALAGPNIPYTYLNVGGVQHEYRSGGMNKASTTICSLTAPAATSTLIHASFRITTGTSTTGAIDFSKAVLGASASTTKIGSTILYAGGAWGAVASSTISGSYLDTESNAWIFPPNYQLNIKVGWDSAVTATVNNLVGDCKAEWIVY